MISIVTPCYRTSPFYLHRLLVSLWPVREEVEWIIVNDCPLDRRPVEFFGKHSKSFQKMKIIEHHDNKGIACSYADGFMAATHEYTAILDHDDEVDLYPLLHLVRSLSYKPHFIYTNERKFSEDYREDFYKPDFDIISAFHYFFMHHITLFRTEDCKSILNEKSSLKVRDTFDIWLTWSLLLKYKNQRILTEHLKSTLYGWRMHEQSTALSLDAKADCRIQIKNTAQDIINLLGGGYRVELYPQANYAVGYESTGSHEGFIDLVKQIYRFQDKYGSEIEISNLMSIFKRIPLPFLTLLPPMDFWVLNRYNIERCGFFTDLHLISVPHLLKVGEEVNIKNYSPDCFVKYIGNSEVSESKEKVILVY